MSDALHIFCLVAFSSTPFILYIPPMRSLNIFLEAVQFMWRETRFHTGRIYPRLRNGCSRILNCLLGNNTG